MPHNATESVLRNPPKSAFERGVRKHLAGSVDDAALLYREAIALDPNFPEACNNLGTIVAAKGNTDEALALFQHACEMAPGYGEALNNVGLIMSRLNRHDEAAAPFTAACLSDSKRADWANNLGNNEVERFEFAKGLSTFDRAIALQPENPEFWNGRSLALRGLRRTEDAIASLHRSLALSPSGLNALSNLGVMLREEKRLPEAIIAFERAMAASPDNPAILVNYASVFELTGDYSRVRELAQRAIAIDPTFAEPYVLLANCELEASRYARCRELLERAIALEPANRNANWNLAIVSLLHGDFENGWREFESRKLLQSSLIDHASYDAPEWDGSPLDGKTILVHTEQGVGDAIQFIRFAASLKKRGAGRVILECPYPIAPLLSGVQGVDDVVVRGVPLPPYDVHVFLMSLPHLLGVRLDSIPAKVPYIPCVPRAAAALINAPAGVLRIGIVWSGNPAHHRDRLRSIAPERFAALFATPKTAWYSLQKGDDVEDALAAFPAGTVKDIGSHLNDFRDTAAVIARLDLVISVDTSVAHLAAALGRPTWLLLPHVPDFRWMLDRTDSPWYPTMRIFRQPSPQQWDAVFTDVAAALNSYDASRDSAATNDAPPDDAPVTTLESAVRLPDGRPRFEVWIPLARLADPRAFAAFEAELTSGGHDLPLRRFWDEALSEIDTFVDDTPGLALTLMSVLTCEHRIRVVAHEEDVAAADRLRLLAPAADRASRLEVVPRIDTAALRGRVAIRVESAEAFVASVGAFASAGGDSSLSIAAVCATAPESVRETLNALAQRGYLAFEVTLTDGEVSLDPVVSWNRAQDFIVISRDALAALSGTASDTPPVEATRGGTPYRSPTRPLSPPSAVTKTRVGIDWEVRSDTGWGVYGTHLALELAARADVEPTIFASDLRDTSPVDRWRLQQLPATPVSAGSSIAFDGLMLKALGNNFTHGPLWDRIRARRQAGVIFFEDTSFDAAALERARSLDIIVAGSNWNAEVLRAQGLPNVCAIQQGIDATVFHPAPPSGRLNDRFVVFSGGKLEYRKGQDLVIAAFRRFRQRHPEALLMTAWHNHWPQLLSDLSLAGHVQGIPDVQDGSLAIVPWLGANGIPADAVLDIGR
ncbi:MAG: tetratricopeptide repeat protein, partial [Gemmatimonadaceae bacterium]